jgi:hypothetical protein
MAFTITEHGEGQSGTTDWRGVQTFKRRFTVQSTASVSIVAAMNALNLAHPSTILYARHPDWPWAVCRDLPWRCTSKLRQVYTIEPNYSTEPFPASGVGGAGGDSGGGGVPGSSEPSPASSNSQPANQRPPTVRIKPKEITKPLEFDVVQQNRVLNNVGDPYDPPPEVFRSHHVITWNFFRSASQLNWPTRSLFQDSINDANFTLLGRTYAPFSLRCFEYSIDPVWETGPSGMAFFWALTVQAEHNPDLWKVKVLNTGRRELKSGKPAVIHDGYGQPVPDPVPLNATGQQITNPLGPFEYGNWNGYSPLNWSTLLA